MRLTGRRQIGQLAPFDLVLLLVVSNALVVSWHSSGMAYRHIANYALNSNLR